MKWDDEIETLKRMVFEEKLSYEEIGRRYNCTSNNIKKVLLRRGIKLDVRSSNKGRIPTNKGKEKKYYCLNCKKDITKSKNTKHKFCSNKCQQEYSYNKWVKNYLNDNSIAKSTKWGQIPSYLRKFIFNKFNNKCCKCGWSETNPFTN